MRLVAIAVAVAVAVAVVFAVGAVRARGNVAVVVKDPVVAVDDAAHVAVLEARIAASNAHRWDAWQAFHTDDCIRTAPDLDVPLRGSAAMRVKIEGLVSVFPDYNVGLVRAVGHRDWLAATLTSSGTLPTGARFAQTWTAFLRFDGDRIAEFHEHYDQLDVAGQLLGASRPRRPRRKTKLVGAPAPARSRRARSTTPRLATTSAASSAALMIRR
jgi:hypothetical protein